MITSPQEKKLRSVDAAATEQKTDYGKLYCLLSLIETPIGYVYWSIGQAKSRIQDRVDNERGAQ